MIFNKMKNCIEEFFVTDKALQTHCGICSVTTLPLTLKYSTNFRMNFRMTFEL